jgi:hypothetical protein
MMEDESADVGSRTVLRLFLFEDFDDVFRIDPHGLILAEEEYHPEIPRGTEIARFIEGILCAVG